MRYAILMIGFLGVAAAPLQAQRSQMGYYGKAIAAPHQAPDMSGFGIDQHLGQQIPLDLVFRDENGHEVTLGSCVGGKPTILVLAYFHCPQMCTLVIKDTLEAVKKLSGDIGDQFNVVIVSFDPKDMPATAFDLQAKFVREYGRAGADKGVHFLCACDVPVPEREKTIKELCDAVGFRFEYDAKSKQFNHASAITVITAYGKISKYIFGLAYQPKEVDAALQEAGAGKIGQEEAEPSKLVSLFCYARDDETGKYSFSIMKVLRILFGTMVLGIAIWLIRAWRQPPKSVSLTQVGQASSLTDESH